MKAGNDGLPGASAARYAARPAPPVLLCKRDGAFFSHHSDSGPSCERNRPGETPKRDLKRREK